MKTNPQFSKNIIGLTVLTNFLVWLFMITLMTSTARAQSGIKELPDKAKRWAVLIGVDEYDDKQHFQNLTAAVNDARALKETLVKYAGFPDDQVILLTSDQAADMQPTR